MQAGALFEEQGKVLQSSDSPLYHWYHSCSNPGRHQQMHVVQAIFYHSTQDTSEKVWLDTVTEQVQERGQRYKEQRWPGGQMEDVCHQTIQVMGHGTLSWVGQVLLQLGRTAVCNSVVEVIQIRSWSRKEAEMQQMYEQVKLLGPTVFPTSVYSC